jgi:hypothetical protein
MEATLCRAEDLWDNWNRKLCNRMQKLTGKPSAISDRILQCIEIERCIQDKANAAILGVDSAESGHSCNDGDSALSDVGVDDALDDVGYDGDEDDVEVAAVNTVDENDAAVLTTVDANIAAVATARHRPNLLPVFVGGGVKTPSAVSTSSSRGGVSRKTNTPVPLRRSPTSLSYTSSVGGQGGDNTKNSANCKPGSISKAMDRLAESIASGGGGDSGSKMMMLMLSMQMQQQTQQLSMHQQMFQQQMQMQLTAMDKHAETSEKYLRWIAKMIGCKKRKRGGSDDYNDESSDDNE